MKDYMVMELRHVSEMVAIKVKVDFILKTFWRPNIPPPRVISCPHANISLIPLIFSQHLCS